jgi:predicted metalloprotease with PDZ domain
MIQTAIAPDPAAWAVTPRLHYRVSMPQPSNHLFEVELTLSPWSAGTLEVRLPVWTPGSYLVREYARHVQDVEALDAAGQPLPWRKLRKNAWSIETLGHPTVVIRYRVFACELSVRTNHLDASHGFFTPAALLMFVPGLTDQPHTVEIQPPAGWQVATALPQASGSDACFTASDYDHLVDSPFEIGPQTIQSFTVAGKSHRWVTWGSGNFDPERAIADTQRIIETEAALFGGLPYDDYLFILHLSANSYGGLEHRDSCVLAYSRFGFTETEQYQRFLQLVAHEFSHLWNVKRLRPKELERFDYERENYTSSLWFCEGVTSYYDLLFPLRAGCYDAAVFLDSLAKDISRYLSIPGRQVQPLSESSFDAWIKLYRRDAYSDNTQISYYLKGALVTLLLDLQIRQHQPGRSFDDVLRQLWQTFGQNEQGYSVAELKGVLEAVAGIDLSDFYAQYIDGLAELPLATALAKFGLQLEPVCSQQPYSGMKLKSEAGRTLVSAVDSNSPAEAAGLQVGDELVALGGFRITADQWGDRTAQLLAACGKDVLETTVAITLFHDDQLETLEIRLQNPRPSRFRLVPLLDATAGQQTLFRDWLGCELESLAG